MSNLTDFVGSSGGLDPRKLTRVDITTSQTWTAPKAVDNKFFVLVQGAGGSGGAGSNASTVANSTVGGVGLGGTAGGYAKDIVTLHAGDSVSVTIGAGGPATSASNSSAQGNAGADSSFGALVAQGGSGGYGSKAGGPFSKVISSPLSGDIRYFYTTEYNGNSIFNTQHCNLFQKVILEPFYGIKSFISHGIRKGYMETHGSSGTRFNNTSGEDSIIAAGGLSGALNANGGDGMYGSGGAGAGASGSTTITSGAGGDGIVIIYYEPAN